MCPGSKRDKRAAAHHQEPTRPEAATTHLPFQQEGSYKDESRPKIVCVAVQFRGNTDTDRRYAGHRRNPSELEAADCPPLVM